MLGALIAGISCGKHIFVKFLSALHKKLSSLYAIAETFYGFPDNNFHKKHGDGRIKNNLKKSILTFFVL